MAPQRLSRSRLLAVGAIAFGPGLLLVYGMLVPLVFVVFLGGRPSSGGGFVADSPDIVALACIAVVPLISGLLGSLVAGQAQSGLYRGLAIYAGLQPIALAIGFLVAASIAGVSMAVAEGATAGWRLKLQELQFALILLAPMQVIVLPWAAVSSVVIGRMATANASEQSLGAA